MIKVCEVCGEEMTKLRDLWNFRFYWFCIGCGATEKIGEDDE